MAGLLLISFDNFLIGTFISLSALGIYERAYRIAQWPSTLLTNLTSRLAFFTYTNLEADRPRLQKTANMILWLVIYFSTPIALVVFIAAPDIISLLYTEKWMAAAPFLRFLIIYSIVRPLLENANSLLLALGQARRVTLLNIIQAAVLILVATPLTLIFHHLGASRGLGANFGAIGTAIGVGVAFLTGLVIIYYDIRRYIALDIAKVIGPPVVAGLVSGGLVFLAITWFDLETLALLPRLALKVTLPLALFAALLFAAQRRQLAKNLAYVIRLVRGSPASL